VLGNANEAGRGFTRSLLVPVEGVYGLIDPLAYFWVVNL
jgi:hypothetical protein